MARVDSKSAARRKAVVETLPFTRRNYEILGAGIVTIVLGYVALAQSPWDGVLPLTVAPILLVLGYCIMIPLGILYRKSTPKETIQAPPASN